MSQAIQCMLPIPAVPTEVLEALHVPAEVWSLLRGTQTADRVLQVWIYLDLQQVRKEHSNVIQVGVYKWQTKYRFKVI